MENKATNRSVSFNPLSIYEWAAKHGAAKNPKQSASAVICVALTEYRERNEPNDELTAAVAQVEAAIAKHGNGLAAEVVEFIRTRKRFRRRA